ncbi:MAG: endolytic transglycosylase MltG [Patescibacteria group bacterium]
MKHQLKRPQKIIIVIGIAAILLLNAAGFFIWQVYFTCSAVSPQATTTVVFAIEKGQGFQDIGLALQKADLIKSRVWFDAYVLLSHQYHKMQAGVYGIHSPATIAQIVRQISGGDVLQEKITIVEGWNSHDIANYLVRKQIFSENDFWSASQEQQALIEDILDGDIPASSVGVEGFLYPDTYQFPMGSSINAVLQEILLNFKSKISDQLRADIKNQGKSFYDILIMASLIEKEVRTYADKQMVAGILWKRLAAGWPLQVDVAPATYQTKGLPDEPICNPGLDSIKAAVYYQENPYWFYLSAPSGQTIFSQTFAQHKAATQKYLLDSGL